MTDIGTRRIFSPEHDMFRETVRKFYKEEVVPYTDKWEQEGEISRYIYYIFHTMIKLVYQHTAYIYVISPKGNAGLEPVHLDCSESASRPIKVG